MQVKNDGYLGPTAGDGLLCRPANVMRSLQSEEISSCSGVTRLTAQHLCRRSCRYITAKWEMIQAENKLTSLVNENLWWFYSSTCHTLVQGPKTKVKVVFGGDRCWNNTLQYETAAFFHVLSSSPLMKRLYSHTSSSYFTLSNQCTRETTHVCLYVGLSTCLSNFLVYSITE